MLKDVWRKFLEMHDLFGLAEPIHEQITALRGQTHRFVGPVVPLKYFLCTILPAICKHHYHLIAVGPWGAALLWHMNRERRKDKQRDRLWKYKQAAAFLRVHIKQRHRPDVLSLLYKLCSRAHSRLCFNLLLMIITGHLKCKTERM